MSLFNTSNVTFKGPTFIEAPPYIVDTLENIAKTGLQPGIDQAIELQASFLGACGLDLRNYGTTLDISDHTDPVRNSRTGEDRTVRFHLDNLGYKFGMMQAFYSPEDSAATEFLVADKISFRDPSRRILQRTHDSKRVLNEIINGEDSAVSPNWFEILTGQIEGSEADRDQLDRLALTVVGGRIVTAPIGFIAIGNSFDILHRKPAPSFSQDEPPKRRVLLTAEPA